MSALAFDDGSRWYPQGREPVYLRFLPKGTYGVAPRTNESPAHLSVQKMIEHLRDGGLPITAIAAIAQVERKTVYTWLDGSAARDHNASRVQTLFKILDRDNINLRSLYRVWNRKLEHGHSISEVLCADPLSELTIENALRELEPAIVRHTERDAARSVPHEGARNQIIDETPEISFSR
ncbi:MAG: hypothetical protein KGQ46_12240 [Hyphomicrobiales bacterium]|nr:hypothetical protein [Hyphomicrobiales bacterium]MDE2115179.1 hypothetical protein [Hyphomicrobiales bacterium]